MTQLNGFNSSNYYVTQDRLNLPFPERFTATNPVITHIRPTILDDVFEGSDVKVPQRKLTFAEKIGEKAIETAKNMKSVGYCFRGVKKSLSEFGVKLWGGSAYMAADQLAKSDKFEEIEVKKEELKSLEKGCVVVWGNNEKHPHGHISISIGDGKEASDHVQKQILNYGTDFRVFKPVEEV